MFCVTVVMRAKYLLINEVIISPDSHLFVICVCMSICEAWIDAAI